MKNNRYLFTGILKNRIYKIKKFENDKNMYNLEKTNDFQIFLGLKYDFENNRLPECKRLLYEQLKIKYTKK